MKVYIVVESLEAGVPHDLNDIVFGVFADEKKAEECMKHLMGYFYSQNGRHLSLHDQKAQDEHGNDYYQIIDRYVE